MPAYQLDEGTLDLPAGSIDQSVNSFSLLVSDSALERQVINVTIARDVDSKQTNAVSYANEQLVVMAKSLPRFELLERANITLLGQATAVLEFSWRPESRDIRQRQTYLCLPTHILVLTLSFAPAQIELANAHWGPLLASLRLG